MYPEDLGSLKSPLSDTYHRPSLFAYASHCVAAATAVGEKGNYRREDSTAWKPVLCKEEGEGMQMRSQMKQERGFIKRLGLLN